jgi:hypothetical protein
MHYSTHFVTGGQKHTHASAARYLMDDRDVIDISLRLIKHYGM